MSHTGIKLINRDCGSFDIFRLKDESLENSTNLASLDVIATEIMEDPKAAHWDSSAKPVQT